MKIFDGKEDRDVLLMLQTMQIPLEWKPKNETFKDDYIWLWSGANHLSDVPSNWPDANTYYRVKE